MAGIITHLIVAREILKLLPENIITEEDQFYAGSIAPDAIHAREGFVRADKKHTHFRDDIPDKEFGMPNNLELFHNRIADFIRQNRKADKELLDLNRGYVVHLLTDELYLLTIRQEYIEAVRTKGIIQSDKEFFHGIVTDMTRNDELLADRYPEMDKIGSKLEHVTSHEISGLLSKDELEASRGWVLWRFFKEQRELLQPIHISYDRTLEFIHMAAADITRRLSEGGSLPRMF